MIKVRAIKKGFYGQLRVPGDPKTECFEIKNEKAFSKFWMVKVDKPKKVKVDKKSKGKEPDETPEPDENLDPQEA